MGAAAALGSPRSLQSHLTGYPSPAGIAPRSCLGDGLSPTRGPSWLGRQCKSWSLVTPPRRRRAERTNRRILTTWCGFPAVARPFGGRFRATRTTGTTSPVDAELWAGSTSSWCAPREIGHEDGGRVHSVIIQAHRSHDFCQLTRRAHQTAIARRSAKQAPAASAGIPSKSLELRVTSVRRCSRTVAAIKASGRRLALRRRSRPARSAIALSTGITAQAASP